MSETKMTKNTKKTREEEIATHRKNLPFFIQEGNTGTHIIEKGTLILRASKYFDNESKKDPGLHKIQEYSQFSGVETYPRLEMLAGYVRIDLSASIRISMHHEDFMNLYDEMHKFVVTNGIKSLQEDNEIWEEALNREIKERAEKNTFDQPDDTSKI